MDYKAKPTQKQRLAIDNILSGKYKSTAEAMREAGYSKKSSLNPRYILASRKGVQNYIDSLSGAIQKRWGITIQDKIAEVYVEGLGATKPTGRKGVELPDYPVRLAYADRLSEFLGWIETNEPSRHKYYKL